MVSPWSFPFKALLKNVSYTSNQACIVQTNTLNVGRFEGQINFKPCVQPLNVYHHALDTREQCLRPLQSIIIFLVHHHIHCHIQATSLFSPKQGEWHEDRRENLNPQLK